MGFIRLCFSHCSFLEICLTPSSICSLMSCMGRHHDSRIYSFCCSFCAVSVTLLLCLFLQLYYYYCLFLQLSLADDGDDDHHLISILCLLFSSLLFLETLLPDPFIVCHKTILHVTACFPLSSSLGCYSRERVSSRRQFCVLLTLNVASSSPSSSFCYASLIVSSCILESEVSLLFPTRHPFRFLWEHFFCLSDLNIKRKEEASLCFISSAFSFSSLFPVLVVVSLLLELLCLSLSSVFRWVSLSDSVSVSFVLMRETRTGRKQLESD